MKRYIEPILRQALQHIGAPDNTEITLERPKQLDHGNLSTNLAMGLARHLKKAPRQIAEELVEQLSYDQNAISKVEIAGPGFINFHFTPAFFQMRLEEAIERGEDFGKSDIGKGIKTNVEYVSANPTGPLHPGHGRNAAIGDTIANILEWTGHDVTREYYFNNAGNQMRNLALSIHIRYRELLGHPTEFPEDGYHGEYIYDIARSIIENEGEKYLEPTDANIDAMRTFGEQWNFAVIQKTMESLRIVHDVFYNEQSLYNEGKIDETVQSLTELGKTYKKDDALWLKLGDDDSVQDRVIVKASGEPTYRLPDIAYHVEKIRRGFELMIDVLGGDHIAAVPDVIAAVGMRGFETEGIRPVIHQMVTFVEGGEKLKLSKRSGKSITLDDLIEDLGADIVRFFFIMRGVSTQLEFDLDLAREQSDKNPVLYLQYAHARTAGVLRFAESEGITLNPNASLAPLVEPETVQLMKTILEFPETLARAARDLEPQIVAEYLREVAVAFHKFFHDHSIVKADTEEQRDARMRLLAMSQRVFANGLNVLGITAPERM